MQLWGIKNEHRREGQKADKPSEIPVRGWKDWIGVVSLKEDHVQIVSAGVGFYFFMAIFPASVAAFSIHGLPLYSSRCRNNSEMEHQTSKDSTMGPDESLGERGGFYADHIAGKNKNK